MPLRKFPDLPFKLIRSITLFRVNIIPPQGKLILQLLGNPVCMFAVPVHPEKQNSPHPTSSAAGKHATARFAAHHPLLRQPPQYQGQRLARTAAAFEQRPIGGEPLPFTVKQKLIPQLFRNSCNLRIDHFRHIQTNLLWGTSFLLTILYLYCTNIASLYKKNTTTRYRSGEPAQPSDLAPGRTGEFICRKINSNLLFHHKLAILNVRRKTKSFYAPSNRTMRIKQ